MSDFNERILRKLTEVSERCARIEADISTMKENIKEVRDQDFEQNKLLAEHIAGTVSNRERLEIEKRTRQDQLKNINSRLVKVEFFPNFLRSLRTVILWIGGSAVALLAITRLFKMW